MKKTDELFRAQRLPVLQNRTYETFEEARHCPVGDVVLVQDAKTGIVHNAAFDPKSIVYDSSYNNEQSVSPSFQTHLDEVADLIDAHLRGRALIEIGCGKGTFLEKLQARGYAITGMDPAYEGANPAILTCHFSAETMRQAEGLVLRHVLEHIQDPFGFLEQMRVANGGGGLIYIEVPCLEWILNNRTWFDIFYEHVNYFRLSDFERIFGKIVSAKRTFGGQYLSVLADLASLRQPTQADRLLPFHDELARCIKPQVANQRERRRLGRPASILWGAASKGVIFSIYMERAGVPLSVAVDINPAKQARFLPCTGIRVLSPAGTRHHFTEGSEILAMNPNYLEEIRETVGAGPKLTSI